MKTAFTYYLLKCFRCPLYSSDKVLHVDAVKAVAKKALEDVTTTNPSIKLKHDPTKVLPTAAKSTLPPGVEENAADLIQRVNQIRQIIVQRRPQPMCSNLERINNNYVVLNARIPHQFNVPLHQPRVGTPRVGNQRHPPGVLNPPLLNYRALDIIRVQPPVNERFQPEQQHIPNPQNVAINRRLDDQLFRGFGMNNSPLFLFTKCYLVSWYYNMILSISGMTWYINDIR